ncbi:hypothetical protein ENSA5_40580 [Enhygromyxa salina]|uniref:N-acetyltransferase domain-containing protein n=1 Tax=Enhygromyxa salina TaxID=215803 RepID=A0A2S9XPF6_9BACT|nr:GNAT family N-acetyltransferase [Enhygromyxa salina]PRP94735.1 hypothetical protein ENSA5_40580 [Enhygromyxa salina]
MTGDVEILGAERLDDLGQLQATAERIFGRGQRRAGWFRRKLNREGVDPRLSAIAMRGEELLGYALLGRLPSLGPVARGAGVGVIDRARGSGIGRALLDFVGQRAGAAGCEAIEFLAEPRRLDWYLGQGFSTIEQQLTLLALGLGPEGAPRLEASVSQRGPVAALGSEALWSWLPEAWQRTPADERAMIQLEGRASRARARLWLTREGRAWLVHRLELSPPTRTVELDALRELGTQLRRRVAPTTPLLLYPCAADSPWLGALYAAGFELAQRSFVVRRPTSWIG